MKKKRKSKKKLSLSSKKIKNKKPKKKQSPSLKKIKKKKITKKKPKVAKRKGIVTLAELATHVLTRTRKMKPEKVRYRIKFKLNYGYTRYGFKKTKSRKIYLVKEVEKNTTKSTKKNNNILFKITQWLLALKRIKKKAPIRIKFKRNPLIFKEYLNTYSKLNRKLHENIKFIVKRNKLKIIRAKAAKRNKLKVIRVIPAKPVETPSFVSKEIKSVSNYQSLRLSLLLARYVTTYLIAKRIKRRRRYFNVLKSKIFRFVVKPKINSLVEKINIFNVITSRIKDLYQAIRIRQKAYSTAKDNQWLIDHKKISPEVKKLYILKQLLKDIEHAGSGVHTHLAIAKPDKQRIGKVSYKGAKFMIRSVFINLKPVFKNQLKTVKPVKVKEIRFPAKAWNSNASTVKYNPRNRKFRRTKLQTMRFFRKLKISPLNLYDFMLKPKRTIAYPPSKKTFHILKVLSLAFSFILQSSIKKQFLWLTTLKHSLMSLLTLPLFIPQRFLMRLLQLLSLKEFSFRFLQIGFFRKLFTSRYFIYQGAYSALVSSLKSFDKNIRMVISFVGLTLRNISASFICNYIVHKLGQYFSIQEILRPIIRDLKYSPVLHGFRIIVAGRLTRKERAAFMVKKHAKLTLSEKSAVIDYAAESKIMRFGVVGIKVWFHIKKRIPSYHIFKFASHPYYNIKTNFINNPLLTTIFLILLLFLMLFLNYKEEKQKHYIIKILKRNMWRAANNTSSVTPKNFENNRLWTIIKRFHYINLHFDRKANQKNGPYHKNKSKETNVESSNKTTTQIIQTNTENNPNPQIKNDFTEKEKIKIHHAEFVMEDIKNKNPTDLVPIIRLSHTVPLKSTQLLYNFTVLAWYRLSKNSYKDLPQFAVAIREEDGSKKTVKDVLDIPLDEELTKHLLTGPNAEEDQKNIKKLMDIWEKDNLEQQQQQKAKVMEDIKNFGKQEQQEQQILKNGQLMQNIKHFKQQDQQILKETKLMEELKKFEQQDQKTLKEPKFMEELKELKELKQLKQIEKQKQKHAKSMEELKNKTPKVPKFNSKKNQDDKNIPNSKTNKFGNTKTLTKIKHDGDNNKID